MPKTSPRRLNALLLSASALAIAMASPGARADTTITGSSGPLELSGSSLFVNGTVLGTGQGIAVTVNGSATVLSNTGFINSTSQNGVEIWGRLNTLANSGSILGNGGYGSGISNFGYVGTVYNTATITGSHEGITNWGTVQAINNSGIVTGIDSGGIVDWGSAKEINNSGTAYGALKGVDILIVTDTVTNSGTIIGGYIGLEVPGGTLGTFVNTGVATGGDYGIQISQFGNGGTIGTVLNEGTVQGGYNGVDLRGTGIGGLTNVGAIQGGSIWGVGIALTGDQTYVYDPVAQTGHYQAVGATMGTLANSASALVTGGTGIRLEGGTIGTLVNDGQIIGTGWQGVVVTGKTESVYDAASNTSSTTVTPGSIGTLVNGVGATISGAVNGIQVSGATIETIANAGLIGGGGYGISLLTGYDGATFVGGQVFSLANDLTGIISGTHSGIQVAGGHLGTLSNSGLIAGEEAGLQITAAVDLGTDITPGTIGTLVNNSTGTIIGNAAGIIVRGATVDTLINAGRINAGGNGFDIESAILGGYSVDPSPVVTVLIGTLANLQGATVNGDYNGLNIYGATIGTLTNAGVINGGTHVGLDINGGLFNGTTIAPAQINNLTNSASGTISGVSAALSISGGNVGSLINDGLISGTYAGIIADIDYFASMPSPPLIGTMVNTGTIMAVGVLTGTVVDSGPAVDLSEVNVGTISNNGLISGKAALTVLHGTIGLLDNLIKGTLVGMGGSGAIQLATDVGTLRNAGLITNQGASTTGAGITISYGIVDTLLNLAVGTIAGASSGLGLLSSRIGTLSNSGTLKGGTTAIDVSHYASTSAEGLDAQPLAIGTFSNTGIIAGGANGIGSSDRIGDLHNSGVIIGGTGNGVINIGHLYDFSFSVSDVPSRQTTIIRTSSSGGGIIGTLANSGTITGGQSGIVNGIASASQTVESRVFRYSPYSDSTSLVIGTTGPIGGTIGTLMNSRTILGTTVAGIDNGAATAVIGTLVNSGLIQGGQTGIINAGTIGTLTNSGTITGAVAAIRDSGTLGPVTNTGVIAGDIVHTAATDLSITGGSGTVFGTLTGVGGARGTLSSTASNVTLAGNLVLNDSVSVAGHTLAENGGSLVLAAPTTITGNYAQAGGTLTVLEAGGTVGGLQVSGSASISGATVVLTSQYAYGLTSGAAYTIVAAGDAASSYASVTALAPGYDSTTVTSTVVGGQTDLIIRVSGSSLSAGGTATISSGAASLDQMTGGSLVLTGGTPAVGTVSGGTIALTGGDVALDSISGGTLTQTGGTASLGTVNGGAIALTGGSATLGAISGGTLTQSGGTATLATVSGGAIALTGGNATLGAISGGTLTQSGGTATLATINGGAIALTGGSATLGTISGGTLTQSGGSASLGTVTGGTIALAGGSATLGTISGGTLTQGAGSTIAGTTAVQVQGGSLNLGGTVQAPLAINGGLVALNGTASGPVTVGSGGTLRGSGVITGAATVAGVLRPGNSPGTLTFTNGLTQTAKSVLSIDIDGTGTGKGAGNYSRVLVTGGSYVIGSGAVLQPNLRGMTGSASNTYTPGLGTDFAIVQAAGGVQGTFAGITQPGSGLLAGTQFTALYGSNAIDLYVTPTYGSLASLGASANQQTMGRVVAGLSSTGNADLGTVLKALYGLPTVGASLDALAQIGGSSQANIVAYSLNRGLAATQVLGQRLAAVRDGVAGGMQGTMQAQLVGRTLYTSMASGTDGAVIEDERGAAAGSAPEEGWHFWAQGLGAFTRVDSDGNAAGGHSNTGGGLFGGDRTVAPGVTLGLAGVLLQSTSGGSNETSSYGLSAYGNVDLGDGLFVTGNAGYTYDQYDTARTMGFGGLSRTAFGHTTGDELSAGVTAGYRVRVSNLTLEPQAGIQWLKVGRDGFTETGAGALNLVLQDLDATALQSSVGGRASASWKTDGGTVITPALRAAWLHDFRDRALTSQAALAGTTFAVTGPDTGANALGIGGGLTLQEGNNLNLYANYDGTLRRHETDHVFTAGFRLSW